MRGICRGCTARCRRAGRVRRLGGVAARSATQRRLRHARQRRSTAATIGLPSGGATIDSATLVAPSAARGRRARPDAGRHHHAGGAEYCKVLGRIAPVDPQRAADPVPGQPADAMERPLGAVRRRRLQRRADHRAGAACRRRRYDKPSPLAQGFVTVGTDSGHQNQAGPAAAGVRAERRGAASTSRMRRTRRCATCRSN